MLVGLSSMMRMRADTLALLVNTAGRAGCPGLVARPARRVERQRQRENAAHAILAVKQNLPAQQRGQLLAQMQPQSRALELARRPGVDLREGLEQQVLALLQDADAGVADADGDALLVVEARGTEPHRHFAAFGELDGVVQQVQ